MAEVVAVVPAAGRGERIGGRAKQFRALGGRSVLARTLSALSADDRIIGFVVVLPDGEPGDLTETVAGRPVAVVPGGTTRAESVRAGLLAAGERFSAACHVAVHDAVRPCLHPVDLAAVLDAGLAGDGAILARRPGETVKRGDDTVEATVDREWLWLAQTPQVFPLAVLLDALEVALARGLAVTDEAAAMEAAGRRVRLVAATRPNPKITWPEDLLMAERLINDMEKRP